MVYYLLAIPPFFFWKKFLSEIFWRGNTKKIPERKYYFFFISSPRKKFPLRKKFYWGKKGGASYSSIIGLAPPLRKPTGFFAFKSLTSKKWSEVFFDFFRHFFAPILYSLFRLLFGLLLKHARLVSYLK